MLGFLTLCPRFLPSLHCEGCLAFLVCLRTPRCRGNWDWYDEQSRDVDLYWCSLVGRRQMASSLQWTRFDSNLAQGHMDGDRPDGIPIVWLDIPFQVSITDHSSSKSVMSKFRAASCYTQFCLVFQGFTWLIKITYFASLSWCWGSHGGFSPCHCKG
ncbi:hypothetical protein CDL15_Pgr022190 [Punica granatum]|uniref:Uncharacterized protein n=1 Tax=Punica granatum TaxID=22663 RepID=A0A218VSH0_PUNGR|nr:hypothetical protein CDL15_Pgr022190 [Punica granatum]